MRFDPGNRAKIRTIKAGSMHLKIYTGTLKKRPIFTVYWRVGEKPFHKLFSGVHVNRIMNCKTKSIYAQMQHNLKPASQHRSGSCAD
jgi:hypothetical protein